MPGVFFDWLEHRTGLKTFVNAMLLEHVPGGARWRYVFGSALTFTFMLQVATGLLLMLSYSPSDTDAWSSVHFIQYQMDFGWLIRGLHHFGSQTMMVLIGLHMLQVVLAGAQLPPREFNWWLGMGLFGITFGLSLTGYLLPWDQKGYWATRVATNIASNLPFGDFIKQVVVGGSDYGNHTLTRFFALHVGILPTALVVLLVAHLALFRRHGVTHPIDTRGVVEMFYPRQVLYDLVACMAVFAVLMMAVCGLFGTHGAAVIDTDAYSKMTPYERVAKAGQVGLGANLDAPADRDTADYPARPEWYFLFLFQLLKYFEGDLVFVGTVLIPNGAFTLLMLLPVLGYGRMRPFGYWAGVLLMTLLLSGALILTLLAFAEDSPHYAADAAKLLGQDESQQKKALEKAEAFHTAAQVAERQAHRAVRLAMHGVPAEGSRQLLRGDPLTRGRQLFGTICASCHKFSATEADGCEGFTDGVFKASDLYDFGSEKWIRGLLTNPGSDAYFGLTKLDGMKKWRKRIDRERKNMEASAISAQEADFDLIAKWLAEQPLPEKKRNKELHRLAIEKFEEHCNSCHGFGSLQGDGSAPDLTDYGSQSWVRAMILSPAHKTRYGSRYAPDDSAGLMPAFRNIDGPGAAVALQEFRDANPNLPPQMVIPLTNVDRELIIRFMMRDWRVVFGGSIISGPEREGDR